MFSAAPIGVSPFIRVPYVFNCPLAYVIFVLSLFIPCVAAPEVVDGLAHDKGVDWWGIGILLWEFLTGESMETTLLVEASGSALAHIGPRHTGLLTSEGRCETR